MSARVQLAVVALLSGTTALLLVLSWIGYQRPLMHLLLDGLMYCF